MTLARLSILRHGGRVPRPHRIQAAGAVYHVFARATGTELLHRDDEDRQRFLSILGDTVDKHRLELHFAVILGTHHHMLITTGRPNIAAAMQHLSGVYCQSFNRRHGRKGHLVAGRYGTKLVESEAHGVRLAAYLALNPVRAGLVDRPEDWPWSSYASLVGLAPEWPSVRPGFLLTQFSSESSRARHFLREYVERVALEDAAAA
jgi:putative transposase